MSSIPQSTGFQGQNSDATADEFDLRDAIDIVASRGWLVALIFVSVSVAGLLYAMITPLIYEADVLIQVEEKKGSTLGGLQQIASALDVSQSPTAGEIEILKSREVIGQAIQVLHRDISITSEWEIPFFAHSFNRNHGGRGVVLAEPRFGIDKFAWGGERLLIDSLDITNPMSSPEFKVLIVSSTRFSINDDSGRKIAEGEVGKPVSFELEGRPATLIIKSYVARPGQSFKVRKLSTIRAYRNTAENVKVVETSRQSSVLRVTAEDDDPHEAVELVNQIAKAYLTQNVSRRSEEAEKSLAFLNQQLPELQRQVEVAEQAFNSYRLSRQSINLDKESEALLTRSIELARQRLDVEMKQQMLSQRFQPTTPELATLEKQRGVLKSEEERLFTQIKRLPETEQEFLRLQRDVKVNSDLYIALLNNAQQLRIAKAGTIGNVRVIDFATASDRPARPNRVLIIGAAAIVGLVFGVLATFIARTLRPTLRHAEEIERLTGLPTYATIPESALEKEMEQKRSKKTYKAIKDRLLHDLKPDDPAIEALRAMRMGLQFAMVDAPNKCIVITGPMPGLGKTFICANLAAILAGAGKRVLIIDTDMRRPRVNEYFTLPRSPGLSTYLAGEIDEEAAINRNVRDNLDVICSGSLPPNPGELLSRSNMKQLLDWAEPIYDYVLLDSAPLLPVGDTLAIAKLVSLTFLVLRAEESTIQQFGDALRRLENAGIPVKGTIFNGLKARRLGYGYRYQYYYSSYHSRNH